MKTTNPYAVTNVNVKQGPRTGNRTDTEKRNEFKAAKAERAPLADTIAKAYTARGTKTADAVDSGLENISPKTKAKFKK